MKACAASTFLASCGIARLSNHNCAPSLGIAYATSTPFLASAARFCACLTSPEKPTAKQISPEASALRYSEEWNLRTDGRTLLTRSAAFCSSPSLRELGSKPRYFSAAGRMSSEESSRYTPQLLNLDSISGLKTMSQLSTLAAGPRISRAFLTL